MLIKIIQGDVSDCIPACIPRCGFKTALKLAKDPQLLENKLNENSNYRKQFILNSKLIDMKHIPMNIQHEIIENIGI